MKSFSEIIEDIKSLKNLSNDYQVAELLGIKSKSMATAKMRNSIPYEELTSFCDKEGIFLNWLLFGSGPKTLADVPLTEQSIQKCKTTEENIDQIKISEDLYLTTKVLESGTSYATALHLNIRSFAQAVDDKERITSVENKQREFEIKVSVEIKNLKSNFETLQGENRTLRAENNRLKATYEDPNGNNGNLTNTNTGK